VEPLRPLVADDPEWTRLAEYLRQRLPSACGIDASQLAGEMDIAQFPGGHSNLTYLVRFGAFELVVRRPPTGPLPARAHDIAREHAWLSALHPLFPLTPQPYLFCDDVNVIGSVFCAMERRRGLVIRQDEPPAIQSPETRRRVSEAMVDTLAKLHAVSVTKGPLVKLGKPKGFVSRQIANWTERWHAAQTTLVPDVDAVAAWLAAHAPADPSTPSVVHGDYKLDNVMLDADDPGRIVAIFDWEMAALGDPLVDLGILLAYWGPTGPPDANGHAVITERPGWLTGDDLVERYARASKRDVSAIRFYEVFALFKIAIVVQQLFARYVRGESRDERFARFDVRVAYLAARATGCISTR
jgi:aminoglycoside phosphotransferase (APT) family kinase protein